MGELKGGGGGVSQTELGQCEAGGLYSPVTQF